MHSALKQSGSDRSLERPAHIRWTKRALVDALDSLGDGELTEYASVKIFEPDSPCGDDNLELFKAGNNPDALVPRQKPGCMAGCMVSLIQCCCHSPEDLDGWGWKLEHSKTGGPGQEALQDDLLDLTLWRRRHMFAQDKPRKTLIAYLSEKDDGAMNLACETSASGVKIEVLDALDFSSISEEVRSSTRRAIHMHHIAFAENVRLFTDDQFGHLVPQQLFPLKIIWTEDSGEVKYTILAYTKADVRNLWHKVMKKKKY